MRALIVIILALFAAAVVADYVGVGDRIVHSLLHRVNFPTDVRTALQQGWYLAMNNCTASRGWPYVAKGGLSREQPFILYFNKASGLITGFSVRTFHPPPDDSILRQYWKRSGPNLQEGQLDVILRDHNAVCGTLNKVNGVIPPIGDRVVVYGQNGMEATDRNIELTNTAAKGRSWIEGNCIGKMCIHYTQAAVFPGRLRYYNQSTLFPVIPMYHAQDGRLNAVLVNIPHLADITPFGPWEGPNPSVLFCKNCCKDDGCKFGTLTIWSTIHFWFRDPDAINCDGARCKWIL